MRQTPLTCSGHTRPVVDLAFSGITPYGYFLISACKGEPAARVAAQRASRLQASALGPGLGQTRGSNYHVLTCSVIKITLVSNGKPMMRQGDTGDWIGTFLGHKGAVWGATLNKEANRAATAAADFSAKVWDAVTGDEMITLAHKHIVKTVDFTQDSNNLLTGGQDKVLRIYDLNKPESEPLEISGHSSGIKKALWCNGDRQIISAADDKTVSKVMGVVINSTIKQHMLNDAQFGFRQGHLALNLLIALVQTWTKELNSRGDVK
eukprot:g44331.t1